MLLALDVGNTNTVLGLYRLDAAPAPAGAAVTEGERDLVAHWRVTTHRAQTSDEYGVLFLNLFNMQGLSAEAVTHIIISSVVPPVESTLRRVCEKYFHLQPLFVEPGIKTGMPMLIDNPTELGADRLVNAIAAYERYGGPCIVVDFGTATTFDVISEKGEYLGGAIAPGLGISADALFSRAARLGRVDIKRPPKVIGTNTITHLQSGLYYGYIGLVDGILERIMKELGAEMRVIATGGLARQISADSRYVAQIDDMLTLDGLRIVFERNRAGPAQPRPLRRAVQNYFNYFTEIEERFQQRRGSLLLLSTLDWSLIETWRDAGLPLEAVLRGIDTAFDKYESRQHRGHKRRINGLAWCAQAVMEAAEELREAAAGASTETSYAGTAESGFEHERVAAHLETAAAALEVSGIASEVCAATEARLRELAEEVRALDAAKPLDTESLERNLTVLEEKLFAALTTAAPEELLVGLKEHAARELAPYRSRMGAVQLRQVERQFVQKQLLAHYNLPRLSLFYMSQQ